MTEQYQSMSTQAIEIAGLRTLNDHLHATIANLKNLNVVQRELLLGDLKNDRANYVASIARQNAEIDRLRSLIPEASK